MKIKQRLSYKLINYLICPAVVRNVPLGKFDEYHVNIWYDEDKHQCQSCLNSEKKKKKKLIFFSFHHSLRTQQGMQMEVSHLSKIRTFEILHRS